MAEGADYQEKAIAWLKSNIPSLRCPVCGSEGFTVGQLVITPVVTNDVIRMELTTPFVPVVCRTCGNTLLFSAVHLGLVAPAPGEGDTVVSYPQPPKG